MRCVYLNAITVYMYFCFVHIDRTLFIYSLQVKPRSSILWCLCVYWLTMHAAAKATDTCAGSRSTDLSWRVPWQSTCEVTCDGRGAPAEVGYPRTVCWCRLYSGTPDEHYHSIPSLPYNHVAIMRWVAFLTKNIFAFLSNFWPVSWPICAYCTRQTQLLT